jgi:hypothetical protein
MRYRNELAALAVVAALAGSGCENITAAPEGSRQLGVLQYEGIGLVSGPGIRDPRSPVRWSIEPGEYVAYAPNAIEAPDTVNVGQAFKVAVHTIGPNGCWRAAGMDTRRSGRIVEFTPWDEDSGAQVCTQILSVLRHDATLALDEKGEWTLRAKGRLVRRGEAPEMPVTAERTVIVR